MPTMAQIGHMRIENSEVKSTEDMMSEEDQIETNRKRKRKNTLQLKVLKSEYIKNKDWSKELITKISEMTGLTESQIYKWNWDQKKKEEDEGQTTGSVICNPNFNNTEAAACPYQQASADKENIDISTQNFKLVGLYTPNKNKITLQSQTNNPNISLKPSSLDSKVLKFQEADLEMEDLGKRKPFGQVNDSRVNS